MKILPTQPRLPDNKVTSVLLSGEFTSLKYCLEKNFNIEVIEIPCSAIMTPDVSTHPDCRFLQIDDKNIIVDRSIKSQIVNYLTINNLKDKVNIIESEREVSSPYPHDALLNATVASNKIICNTKYIDHSVINYAVENSFDLIHTNQGYAACSVILLNDTALITDDESIYNSAAVNGFDCLYVRKGSVRLKEREYGFIGGTYGMIDKNLIVFSGRLDTHIDCNLITDFLYKYNISFIELCDGPLIDLGGIIPLLQEQ